MSEQTVTSPCVSICLLNDEDICVGCYRSAEEIRQWMNMDDDCRRDVLIECADRAKQINPFA